MRCSFGTWSHFGRLLQHWPSHYHSQSRMGVTVWHPGHLSIRWTFVSVILHSDRRPWVVMLLRLLLHNLLQWLLILRMRMMMMVMTMMLQMMTMEMLALPMRCLLDTLTLYHWWQKGKVVLDMRVVILRGRVSIGHFVRGSVDIWRMQWGLHVSFSFLYF